MRIELNKIYKGDCLEGMENIDNDSIDLVLTDPPYNISMDNNFSTMGRKGIDFGEWDKNFNITSWIETALLKLKKGGTIIIFNGWKNLGEIAKELERNGAIVKDMIRWEKSNPMPRNRDRRYICDFECAIVAVKKGKPWVFNRLNDNYDRAKMTYPIVSGKEKTGHTTQKPVKLFEELIRRHSNENSVVLDPFIGSGTTAIASMNTNRNFIGFELENDYYKMSLQRIEGNK